MSAVQVNFRTTPEERRLIREIAERLERREGDALRFIVRKAARDLAIAAPALEPQPDPPSPPAAPQRKAA